MTTTTTSAVQNVAQKNKSFWWYWLMLGADGVCLFGLAFLFLPDAMISIFDWLLYSGVAPANNPFKATAALPYITFAHRVLGAVMLGWGTLLVLILLQMWGKLGWSFIAISLVVWFVPDTFFSLTTGFAGNALLNLIVLVTFAIPLAATYKSFFKRTA